ncbi:2-oxo acid dehydrogenase subunit E2, partial [Nocardia sp. AB354]|uniref:2-oxo acid dehydrogenase subunit E2 n=1 Tax=Nocardia sp. AB354 TaxID=3413283 RepID=UPI003C1ED889
LGDGSGTAAAPAPSSAPVPQTQPASARQSIEQQPEPADIASKRRQTAPHPGPSPADAAPAGSVASSAADTVRRKSSPLARKIAQELGVDIATVTGTGPGGRITRLDVENAHAAGTSDDAHAVAASKAAEPGTPGTSASGDYDEIPLTTIQRVSANRLTESKQQAPHIYLTSAVDVTELLAFRARINESLADTGAGKVSVNDLLVKAVATAL